MKKIERMNAIIYALQESGKLTAREIAKQFEVSERTIYRDIDALSQMKVPIIAYDGNLGGYEIDQHYFMPSVKLTEEEVTILLMLLTLGKELKVPDLYQQYELLRLKLLNTIPKDNGQRLGRFLDKFEVYINRINPIDYVEGVLDVIIRSLEEDRRVKISYYTPMQDTLSEREVSPYRFVFDEGGWYLIGYCHLRGEKRIFRLDRIKQIELLEGRCTIPLELSLKEEKNPPQNTYQIRIDKRFYELIKQDYYMEEHSIIEGSDTYVLEEGNIIEASDSYVMEEDSIIDTPNSHVIEKHSIKKASDTYIIEIYTHSEISILELALKNPTLVQVLGPQSLCEQLRNLVKYLGQLYH